ncbi:MAG: MBL fold metallo-hydrolase [Candidatus Cloacimonetes bacterium HGW-Cloacimonetes-3]|jgi:glyoxylase-like metal-dependent hydrolase (beta-lactamase superfamily II)|nr:MAG: MBL fold metallo-hydrolase [Candidatus Cloacimonetes bacterium HGW-Cloacimonetes-3]
MIKLESFILLQEYQINTWLLWDTESLEALLIDPGAPSEKALEHIRNLHLKVKLVVNTHGHGDHIGGNRFFSEALGCPVAIHTLDADMLINNSKNLSGLMGYPLALDAAQHMLYDGEIILLGNRQVKVIHTPGHTLGGICLLADKYLISGDTLFEQSIGRTDLPGGSSPTILKSIKEKLFTLDDDVLVFPGHGPATSIGLEKANNPFVR